MTQQTIKRILMFLTVCAVFCVSAIAFAEGQASVEVAQMTRGGWIAIAAGLCLGIAAFGGALGQGRAATAALEGIARNPQASDKLFVPMILGLALIESLVIYALILAILLQGKI